MAKLVFGSAISQEDGSVYEIYWNTTSFKLGVRTIVAATPGEAAVSIEDLETDALN
jgi:hypothetical protein